ncbi:MAG: 30S ribosomal protein S6 [Oscillospiraceae bacterium]|nr:30S ribosomal protein S6 [Oscillospiraceae bacterium]
MAKLSANYEAVYIIDPRKNEEDTAALVEKFKALAETHATQVEVDEWGKRRLAYPIQDQTDGHYVRMTFVSAPVFPAELDRIFRITDGVMRSIIVCLDE